MKKGVVKFCCYSNDANNQVETASTAYRFLKDAIVNAVEVYLRETQEPKIEVHFACGCDITPSKTYGDLGDGINREVETENELAREAQYVANAPRFSFARLILNEEIKEELMRGVKLFENYDLIFNKWGLKINSPQPVVAFNFYGPPGTGKTLAAHAIADHLKKNIIETNYSELASMYQGEGPKNISAIFKAAEKQNAILFIDEADSLMSQRLSKTDGSADVSVNAMRSQLLISLERFNGIVIFATNLVKNYDRAFESRVRSIEIPLPNEDCRKKIWELHLPNTFPVDEDVVSCELAKIDDISGREIRNAVQCVAESMALKGIEKATKEMFEKEILRIKSSRFQNVGGNSDHRVSVSNDDDKQVLTSAFNKVLSKKKSNRVNKK